MFEEIFFPRTAERYRAAPLVEQRERYLVHLKETGTCRFTLRKCANDQLSLVRLLNLQEDGRVRLSQIEAVTAIWSRPKARRCHRPASSKARSRFISRAVQWLRFLGLVRRTRQGPPSAIAPKWMPSKHGCAVTAGCPKATIQDYWPPPTTSSIGSPQPIFPWRRSRIVRHRRCHQRQRRRGGPGADGRCTITRSV